MIKLLTIVGARPQFIKAAMLSKAIKAYSQKHPNTIEEVIVHTGQHYDPEMSDVFFKQMDIPTPSYNLKVGGSSSITMIAQIMLKLESIFALEKPNYLVVYGDTNSTLSGALVASHLKVPIIHIEAGLRSFNRTMPEEINRVLVDHITSLFFCPTNQAVCNLEREGILDRVFLTGDVMYDAALHFGALVEHRETIFNKLELKPKEFVLATFHRAENTDDPNKLKSILSALDKISDGYNPVICPLHPRTRKNIELFGLQRKANQSSIIFIPPVDYLDMVALEKNAKTIITDSGGIQKEAYFHQTPCITLREETEWVETIQSGWNILVGADKRKIIEAFLEERKTTSIAEYGNGHAAEEMVDIIATYEP